MIMVAMITVPASEIDMNDNVPLTITITDTLPPYSNHSAFLWDILIVFPFSPVVIWLAALSPALHGHQRGGTRTSRAQPLARLTRPQDRAQLCVSRIGPTTP